MVLKICLEWPTRVDFGRPSHWRYALKALAKVHWRVSHPSSTNMAERPSMFQLIEQTSGFPELAVRFLLCLLTGWKLYHSEVYKALTYSFIFVERKLYRSRAYKRRGKLYHSRFRVRGKDPDANPQWDGVANMKIISYETSLSVLEIIQSFHLQTSLWLVRYVYKRLKFLGNRFLSLGLSQTFLAVWHGYMIGYYLLFVLQFFYVVFEKTFISTWQRFGGLPVYDMPFLAQVPLVPLLYVVKQMMTSYGCVPLALLHWHKIQRVFTLTYYAPVVLVCAWDLVLYPLVFYPAVRSKSRTNVKKWS
ncbi:predicted protein [Nematostella vectensis]|uniref:Uncharacterized protein n=1 Tax=Nematostella vectensis TaxID=45351 RepID=A7RU27_NEMVE|nr:predicted protein [Nematostella vectensis]|eukprot:XP_001637004.1 predicted protein [Nematostella vectensis]